MITIIYKNADGEPVVTNETRYNMRYIEAVLGMVEALNPDSLMADATYLFGKKGIVGAWIDGKTFEGIDTRMRLRVELRWIQPQAH